MLRPTIVFDVGGTILDHPDISEIITRKLTGRWPDEKTYRIVRNTYEASSTRNRDHEAAFQNLAEVHAEALVYLSRQYGYPDISAEARELTIDVYGRWSSQYPDTISVLERLLAGGVTMVIASDNDREILAAQKAKHGLDRYFAAACISEDARAYKPSRGFLDRLRQCLPAESGPCYFVGDKDFDIECGRRLGMTPVLISPNGAVAPDAENVIRTLDELVPLIRLG